LTLRDPLDALDLAEGKRLAIVEADNGLAALPMVHEAGQWRRAVAGDGVAEALLQVLAKQKGSSARGNFAVQSWCHAASFGERAVGVDQTNESVIVGEAAVVKWAAHLQEGPHPAPRRIAMLRAAGFTGMPTPWGLITWQPPDGEETLAVSVDEYLPSAVDGWTWAVDAITDAVTGAGADTALAMARQVGSLVADLHVALAGTAAVASQEDADRWRVAALQALETVCALADSPSVMLVRERHDEISSTLERLGALVGTTVIDGHGDLHVGQALRSGARFVVTDFDGNPILEAHERMRPIPAALDVAGMAQSLAHAAIVAARYTDLDPGELSAFDMSMRSTFLAAYRARIAASGLADLYDEAALYPLRLQQVLREIIYAARHLPRWMYVPDAALPALLDEGTRV
jgi:maltokinase